MVILQRTLIYRYPRVSMVRCQHPIRFKRQNLLILLRFRSHRGPASHNQLAGLRPPTCGDSPFRLICMGRLVLSRLATSITNATPVHNSR